MSLPTTPNVRYAGLLLRTIATMLDMFFFILPGLFYLMLALKGHSQPQEAVTMIATYITVFLLWPFLLQPFVVTLLTHYAGGTVGQILCGIWVADTHYYRRLSLRAALFRSTIGMLVGMQLLGTGFVAIQFDKHRQGWHDKVSGSYVLRRENSGLFVLLGMGVLILCILALFLLGREIFYTMQSWK